MLEVPSSLLEQPQKYMLVLCEDIRWRKTSIIIEGVIWAAMDSAQQQ